MKLSHVHKIKSFWTLINMNKLKQLLYCAMSLSRLRPSGNSNSFFLDEVSCHVTSPLHCRLSNLTFTISFSGLHCWPRICTCWGAEISSCWWCCYEEPWWERSNSSCSFIFFIKFKFNIYCFMFSVIWLFTSHANRSVIRSS